jgi:radical SAM protein with 4Fe4S-binding SPASM domain
MRELGYAESSLWHINSPFLSAPITTHFAVTNLCPMGCKTCYNLSGPSAPDELSTAEAKRVLDVLAEMRVFTVAFGGGEPLARSDLFELAHYARQRGITPTLTTNGFYIDRRMARRCRVFSHIHVSLDGVSETYEAVRGVDGFEYAARALELLTGSGISVGVNCVVCRANFDYLEELVRFVLDYKVRDVIFLRLKPGGRARSSYMELGLKPEQRRSFCALLNELTLRYGIYSHVDCAMMPFIYWHRPDKELLDLFAAEGCIAGNDIIEIQPDGRVRACSFAADTACTAFQLADSWHTAPSLKAFRRWTENASEPCRSCGYLPLCRGGCHAVAEALTGDLNNPDPECPFVSDWVRRE